MSYFFACFSLFVLLFFNSLFDFSPTIIWIVGYLILFATVKNKNPLDPRAWLFFVWGLLFVNVFSGVVYVPNNVSFTEPLLYIFSELAMFFLGFSLNDNNRFKFNNNVVKDFLRITYGKRLQNLLTVLGLISIIGALSITIDLLVFQGFSLNGGDRRQQLYDISNFSLFTTVGMITLGGCYMPALSLFFGGILRNRIIGIFSLMALSLASMALAGKQGILISLLVVFFGISLSRYFKIKFVVPLVLKILLASVILFFGLYIVTLSSERHGDVDAGELLEQSTTNSSFVTLNPVFVKEMTILPNAMKNTFAEFFGYFGDQLGTFAERWQIENYPQKYGMIKLPPRVLNPFTWLERQVSKIFPIYDKIYPPWDWIKEVDNQSTGYYGLANWQTTSTQGIKIFGWLGQLIVIFFHGFFSKRLYVKVGSSPSFSTIHISMLNNIWLVYTIMMNFLGETSAFFYLVLILLIYYNKKKFFNYNV